MTDLKLIDELLVDLKGARNTDFETMYRQSSLARNALDRLKSAWLSGETTLLTLSLFNYFSGPISPVPCCTEGEASKTSDVRNLLV